MSKNSDKKQYPVEFPSRKKGSDISPITDVAEAEIFPLEFDEIHNGIHIQSGALQNSDSIAEVVATEIDPRQNKADPSL